MSAETHVEKHSVPPMPKVAGRYAGGTLLALMGLVCLAAGTLLALPPDTIPQLEAQLAPLRPVMGGAGAFMASGMVLVGLSLLASHQRRHTAVIVRPGQMEFTVGQLTTEILATRDELKDNGKMAQELSASLRSVQEALEAVREELKGTSKKDGLFRLAASL